MAFSPTFYMKTFPTKLILISEFPWDLLTILHHSALVDFSSRVKKSNKANYNISSISMVLTVGK